VQWPHCPQTKSNSPLATRFLNRLFEPALPLFTLGRAVPRQEALGAVGKRRWRARTPRPVVTWVAQGEREASWSAERSSALAGKCPAFGPDLARIRHRIALDLPARTAQDCPMPRQRRVECEGAVCHVLSRGDRRKAIFPDALDRHATWEVGPASPACCMKNETTKLVIWYK
jgi:hypothetical protein